MSNKKPGDSSNVRDITTGKSTGRNQPEERASDEAKEAKKSAIAERVLAACDDFPLWKSPAGGAFASVDHGPYVENYEMDSQAFKEAIRHRAHKSGISALTDTVLFTVTETLKSRAKFDVGIETFEPAIRVSADVDLLSYDLCNEKRQAIEIRPDSIKLVDKPAVKFIRHAGMAPQVMPNLDLDAEQYLLALKAFRKLLRLYDPEAWALLQGVIVYSFRPGFPKPLVVITSEPESGKTAILEAIREVIDPSHNPILVIPDNVRDLRVTAANCGSVLILDNVSHLPDNHSDVMAAITTGTTIPHRAMGSDRTLLLTKLLLPIMIGCVHNICTRHDLASRSVVIRLDQIPDNEKWTVERFKSELEILLPDVLGAFMHAASGALKRLPDTHLDSTPRMADFARWAVAAEPDLDMESGEFLESYQNNRHEDIGRLTSENPLVETIVHHLDLKYNDPFELTPLAMLDHIRMKAPPLLKHRLPKRLWDELKLLVRTLSEMGVLVERVRSKDASRAWVIRFTKILTAEQQKLDLNTHKE